MNKDIIDALLDEYVKLMPKTAYLMKNPDRYPEVEKAAREIADMALTCDGDAKIEMIPDKLTGSSLCLRITADLFTVDMIDKFCEALKKANTFETNALTNGQVQIGMTFEDAWIPASPSNK